MSQHDEHHHMPGAGGDGYESDMAHGTPGVVAAYMVVLTVAFFATVGAVYMYFRHEVDLELQRKVYSVQSEELNQLRQEEGKALSGKMDKAMNQVLSEAASK